MKKTVTATFILAALFSASSVLAQTALAPMASSTVRRNAQEEIPEAFIGAWKLDLANSTYGTAAPKMQYRIFDYTADGKFLCHYITLSAKGTQSAGNWAVSLDGAPGIEYTRAFGSTPGGCSAMTRPCPPIARCRASFSGG